MNEIEQLFGQFLLKEEVEKKDHDWRLVSNVILVLLTVGILTTLMFLSVAQILAPNVMETFVSSSPVLEIDSQKKNEGTAAIQKSILPTTHAPCPSPATTVSPTMTPLLPLLDPKLTIHDAIYQSLVEEFHNDLSYWSASIEPQSLTVSFHNPRYYFEVGRYLLNPDYQTILANFFPRYVEILKRFANFIEALNIEGHTSSEWTGSASLDEAYFNNLILSQQRTRAVLEYCLQLPSIQGDKGWLRQILSANGLSSSRLIIEQGLEKPNDSRRVEFRIVLK